MEAPIDPAFVAHSTFSIERSYPATPARVFRAFSDQATKRRWFAEGEGWHVDQFILDFRVGGSNISRFRYRDGPPIGNDTVFLDIVPEQRIVFAYTMTVAGIRISVSLATVTLERHANGTRLVYTEQGAFFDREEAIRRRELGCQALLDSLAHELERHS